MGSREGPLEPFGGLAQILAFLLGLVARGPSMIAFVNAISKARQRRYAASTCTFNWAYSSIWLETTSGPNDRRGTRTRYPGAHSRRHLTHRGLGVLQAQQFLEQLGPLALCERCRSLADEPVIGRWIHDQQW